MVVSMNMVSTIQTPKCYSHCYRDLLLPFLVNHFGCRARRGVTTRCSIARIEIVVAIAIAMAKAIVDTLIIKDNK